MDGRKDGNLEGDWNGMDETLTMRRRRMRDGEGDFLPSLLHPPPPPSSSVHSPHKSSCYFFVASLLQTSGKSCLLDEKDRGKVLCPLLKVRETIKKDEEDEEGEGRESMEMECSSWGEASLPSLFAHLSTFPQLIWANLNGCL
jgi:hypothetical protein